MDDANMFIDFDFDKKTSSFYLLVDESDTLSVLGRFLLIVSGFFLRLYFDLHDSGVRSNAWPMLAQLSPLDTRVSSLSKS